ncbi:AIM24 family protein [uncultured Anaerovibrio sp.]|uniref:AIM24 family protein n=1 Tax=uncultured Anaerovibrio sp. TaxID=361586 RepID=UPI0026283896|nr:AIM24 family protein [uncultured Anaerovibrio sp.]
MFCTNCGQKLPDGSRFCTSCGTKLGSTTSNTGQVENDTMYNGSFTVKQEEGTNRCCVSELGAVKVYEYKKDLSTNPLSAMFAYYASEMNIRKRQVWIELKDDSYRLQAGAMQMMIGNISAKSDVMSAGDFLGKMVKSVVNNESAVKPLYSGSGTLILEPTYKHIILVNPKDWDGGIVVEDGMYLASSGDINIDMQSRANFSSAILGGEGLFNTKLVGDGVAVLESSVPYDELMEITLENSIARIDGPYAVAWSGNLDFTVEKVNKSFISSMATGEGVVNVYRGTGKILVAPIDDLGEQKAIDNTSSSNANPNSQAASKAGSALKFINNFLDD